MQSYGFWAAQQTGWLVTGVCLYHACVALDPCTPGQAHLSTYARHQWRNHTCAGTE